MAADSPQVSSADNRARGSKGKGSKVRVNRAKANGGRGSRARARQAVGNRARAVSRARVAKPRAKGRARDKARGRDRTASSREAGLVGHRAPAGCIRAELRGRSVVVGQGWECVR